MARNGKKIIAMKPDGTFIDMKNTSSMSIGEKIEIIETSTNFNSIYRYISIIAACIIIFIGGTNVRAYYAPYGYLNVDINPSIQLEFNKFERVLSVKALNEDGQKVLDKVPNYKNTKLEEVTQDIVEEAYDFQYINTSEENNVVLSLYSPDNKKITKIQNKIDTAINNYLANKKINANLLHEIATKENISKAKEQNVSVGKLIMFDKLKEVKPEITLTEANEMSMKDILKTINEAAKDEKNIKKELKETLRDKKEEIINPVLPNEPEDGTLESINENTKAVKPKISKPNLQKPPVDDKLDSQNQFENKQNELQNKIDKIPSDSLNDSKINSYKDRINNIRERIGQIENKRELKNQ